jgi:hypothetical protein
VLKEKGYEQFTSTQLVSCCDTVGSGCFSSFSNRYFLCSCSHQNPGLTIVLVLLYEIIIFIISIIGKIWQKLESPWINQIANWLDTRVRSIVSGYQGHYCQYLIYQHRDFDVKGLSTLGTYTLDLEQVFVELSIAPKPPHQTSADPLKVPEALRIGQHSIWDYLVSEPLIHQHLVIIGAPGSGKTTLLKHIALTLVNRKKLHRKTNIPYKLPFLLFLRDYVTTIKHSPTFSLVEAVQSHVIKWGRSVPTGWVERRLNKGNCLILLDGLDEVADPEMRRQIVNWVQQQMITYGKNRFIVTSRPFGYRSNPLSGVTVLEVNPFTPEQIERFIQNWYFANEVMSSQRNDPGVHLKAKDGAQDLVRRLRNTPTLFALAVNPLLLTMIATVHRYRGSLPGTRIALYAEICEVFLGKRQESRGLTVELSPAQKIQVLQPLAYHMMLNGIKEIPITKAQEVINEPLKLVSQQLHPEAFLQLVENTTGLLLEREHGLYSFAHLTFQEYLAAMYIRDNKLEDTLKAQVGASWWHETIRLYCAQADASPIIAACLSGDRPSIPALTLAIECQKEALKVQPAVSTQLDTLLDQGVEDEDSERSRIIAEALFARRLRQLIYIDENTYADTSLITCVEYQIFLDDKRSKGKYSQPDHWVEEHFPTGQGRLPILGVRPSDAVAFCNWLNEREPGVLHYRLPKTGEYKKGIGYESVSDKMIVDTGYWVERGRGFEWAKGGSPLEEGMKPIPFDFRGVLKHDLNRNNIHDRAREICDEIGLQFIPKTDFILLHVLDRIRPYYRMYNLDIDKPFNFTFRHSRLTSSDHNKTSKPYIACTFRPSKFTSKHDSIIKTYERVIEQSILIQRHFSWRTSTSIFNQLCKLTVSDFKKAYESFYIESMYANDDFKVHFSENSFRIDITESHQLYEILEKFNFQQNIIGINHVLSLIPDQDTIVTVSLTQDQKVTLSFDYIRNLGHILEDACNILRERKLNVTNIHAGPFDKREVSEFLRWYIRTLSQELATCLMYWSYEKPLSHSWKLPLFNLLIRRKPKDEFIQHIIDKCLDIFVAIELLEERVQGTFPANEGIFIIQEHRGNVIDKR